MSDCIITNYGAFRSDEYIGEVYVIFVKISLIVVMTASRM